MISFAQQYATRAKEWARLGVPYRHRGLTRRGCDCSGMLIGIGQELGKFKSFKLRKYRGDWNMHSGACDIITTELDKVADRVPNVQLGIGDILVFRFGNCDAHAGVFIGDISFVHSVANSKCQLGIIRDSKWSSRWTLTYRFNNEKMSQFT